MQRGRCRGKSLLELVIVLTIIGVLLALSAPYYVKAVKMARAAAEKTR